MHGESNVSWPGPFASKRPERTFSVGWLIAILAVLALFAIGPAGAQPASNGPLKVAVYTVAPYATVDNAGQLSGHSVRLWTYVAAELGRPFNLIGVDKLETIFSGLQSRDYDIAIGAITVTPVREALADFSHPVHPSGIAVAIRRASGIDNALNALGSTFFDLLPLFVLVAFFILLAGFGAWLLERRARPAVAKSRTTIASLGDGIYWAAVTMTTVGYGDKTPKSISGKALTIIWMFIGVVVISIFSGSVTAKLTATQMGMSTGAESALRLRRHAAVRDSSGAEFLKLQNLPFASFDTLADALSALNEGKVDAVFNSRGALIHHVSAAHGSSVEVLSGDLSRGWMAFALPQEGREVESLNRAILKVLASRAWAAERETMAREYGASGQPDRQTF